MKKKITLTESVDEFKSTDIWRINKNAFVISLAFMLHFTAYSGAANLQSSINAEAGLGTASLAAVYAGLIASNVFLPVIVIKWIGCKWAMALSFIAYMPYIAAQLWPTFYTLIPAGIFVGFGGGPLWCAKCTYLTVISEVHNQISGVPVDVLVMRFFGLFFMVFQMNQVWGNLISSIVLSSGDNEYALTSVNETLIPEVCGANFLPSTDAGEALHKQPEDKIRTIAGIYLACMVAACLIVAIGVDSLKRYDSGRKGSGTGLSGTALIAVTMKLLKEPNQLLLIMMLFFIGLQQAFFGADFTAAFVSCAIGTGTVGFVMMTFGLTDAISCLVTGYLVKITGRVPLVIAAALLQTVLLLTMLMWKPDPSQLYMFFIIAALWGLSDSIWLVHVNAFCGLLFPGREEAAYSNFRLWESVGFIVAYLYSPFLRMRIKIIILLVMLVLGVIQYLYVEYKASKENIIVKSKKSDPVCVKGCDNIAFQNVE